MFSVVCPTKYLESNVKQFLCCIILFQQWQVLQLEEYEASVTVMPDVLENIEQRCFLFF